MGIQETPLAIDGVIYSITSGNRVAALDGKTGQEIWSYEPRLNPLTKKILFAPYSRGVAVGHGMVFIGTVDGRGIALDQKTGRKGGRFSSLTWPTAMAATSHHHRLSPVTC